LDANQQIVTRFSTEWGWASLKGEMAQVSVGILINFGQSSIFNSLILLGHISAETPGSAEKGVFQHNRPLPAIHIAKIQLWRPSAFWLESRRLSLQ
jgi:hypothetical protein